MAECRVSKIRKLNDRSAISEIKCMPFSRESVPKFGTLFLIQLKSLNVRPFVKNKGTITKLLAVRRQLCQVSRLIKLFNTLG